MKNGLIGTHIATGIPVELILNAKEMQLAMVKENINECWELMNDAVFKRTADANDFVLELPHCSHENSTSAFQSITVYGIIDYHCGSHSLGRRSTTRRIYVYEMSFLNI